jgi:hypothetical protein
VNASQGNNMTRYVGPGPVQVRLTVRMNQTMAPIWNVVAKIEGSAEPDRVIVLGNHRDAW